METAGPPAPANRKGCYPQAPRSDMDCAEEGCQREAAVRLHVPWDDDREVCTAHARPVARKDGVVAEPLEGAESEWS